MNAHPYLATAADTALIPLMGQAWQDFEPPLLRETVLQSDLQPLRPLPEETPDWVFGWLLFLLSLLALIRAQFGRELQEWWRALWNSNLAFQLQRNREYALTLHGILLFVLFAASMGTWVWIGLNLLGVERLPFNQPLHLLNCIVSVVFVIFLRDAMRRLTGMLFRAEEVMAFFGFEIALLQALVAVLLIPLLFALAYAAPHWQRTMLVMSSVLLAGMFLLRMFRGWMAASALRHYNPFGFLLYICALEVAPVAVAAKVVSAWLSSG